MFVQIVLLSPPFSTLTYKTLALFPAAFFKPGMRVVVPLGRGKDNLRVGFILECRDTCDLPDNVTIKPIIWPLDTVPLLPRDLLHLILELSIRQGEEPGRIARGFLLPGFYSLNSVLHYITQKATKVYALAELAHAKDNLKEELALALLNGAAKMLPGPHNTSEEEYVTLNCDPPWPVRPGASLQIKVLEYLHTNGTCTRKMLNKGIGSNATQAVRSLLSNGYLLVGRGEEGVEEENLALLPPATRPFELNEAQVHCVEELMPFVQQKIFHAALLYGVTGSGKTAVYLDLAVRILALGRSVIILVPEVALALKLLQDVHTSYPEIHVILYHGYQTSASREKIWRETAEKSACLVIGTRSALFVPVQHLGCVILDEEHDASFKQDEGFLYHAKEIAWSRAKEEQAILLLGSATPDVRTFYAAQMGAVPLLRLAKRVSGRDLPPIELVNTREPKSMSEAVTLLSTHSLDILQETIGRGEQVVILINRRGYAPHMYCLDCGKTEHCPNCEITLTYHKARGRLVCHYCGYSKPYPAPCSTCGAAAFLPMGEGTERLAEELSTFLGQRVLRLDRDSTSRPGRMEEILHAFAREEAQVLVGTQMLSKGHHFPKVTLVIAADCDMGLNFPDYRAAERTFQLLLQSAGRAGRGALPGRVLLQTRDVTNYCLQYVVNNDYEGFYQSEISRRELHQYPPFVHLALIRLSFEREDATAALELQDLSRHFRVAAAKYGVTMLGPAPAPLSVIRNRERFQILLKGQAWSDIRETYHSGLQAMKIKHLRTILDLDPVNML